jgi:replicative DNA helicase
MKGKNMKQYDEMERAILNCLIIEPDLFKNIKVSEKHFKNHKNFYLFLKKYYDTFGRFDIQLLKTACKNPGEALDYIADIIDTTSIVSNFDLYQERLLQMRTDFEKIEDVHKLEQRLYSREITLEQFDEEFKTIMGRIQ